MNTKTLIAISTLVILGMTMPVAAVGTGAIQYQYTAGMIALQTEDIGVMIPAAGEVPHFRWWDPNNTEQDYHMMFVKLFEANDTNSDGVFTLGTDHIIGPAFALPTTDWEFSGFDVEYGEDNNTSAVHFNLTSTTTHDPRPAGNPQYGMLPYMQPFNVTIQIRVHISTQSLSSIKFDIILAGWQWTYNDSILVLQFTLTQSKHGAASGTNAPEGLYQEQTRFQFGNGYMQYEPTALAAQNTIQVKASHGVGTGSESGEAIYLAFENFGNDTLVYDPTIGIGYDGTVGLIPLTPEMLLVVSGLMVLFVAVAVIIRKK